MSSQPSDLYFFKAAKFAYERYADSANWKNFRGDKMPQWIELPQPIRNHWFHTVQCMLGGAWQDEVTRMHRQDNQ